MLSLSRMEGQAVQVGDDVTVVIQRIKGNRVVLGFEGPQGVRIMRTELLEGAGNVATESIRGRAQDQEVDAKADCTV